MFSIYVDLDDVLTETARSVVDIVKQELGREIAFEQITSFDIQKAFNFSQVQFDYFFDLIHQPEIILNLRPVEGAIGVLQEWSEKGYKIDIVTGRLTSAYESSLEWLSKHNVPFRSFIMVNKYSRQNKDGRVAISLDELSKRKFHFAIEDSLKMAEYISQTMDASVILYDRPWNRSKPNNNITRCMDWEGIRAAISRGI
jgi:uncharacterized HAD superfamily protein